LQGDLQLENPWGYANRREIASLILFTHRFYHPQLMRWITTDPIGFEDGLNLYRFVRNNPYCYRDPDGRFAIVVEIVIISFEALCVAVSETTIGAILGTVVGVSLAVTYNDDIKDALHLNQVGENEEENGETKSRKKGKDNEIKGGPSRDPKTANYLPDPAAEGSAHTTLGTKQGRYETYTQGATFENKEFKGRTDVTNHGRYDHPNPHYHPATSPNSVKPGPHPIPSTLYNF
jgi:RHS repeat-associated protein